MSRKKKYTEKMMLPLPAGTFDRVAAMLHETQDRTDYVREALAEKLERDERAAAKRKALKPSEGESH